LIARCANCQQPVILGDKRPIQDTNRPRRRSTGSTPGMICTIGINEIDANLTILINQRATVFNECQGTAALGRQRGAVVVGTDIVDGEKSNDIRLTGRSTQGN